MIATEVKIICDRCGEEIPKEHLHAIIWHDAGREAEYDKPMEMDLCSNCYNTVVKQVLADYSYHTKEK